MKWLSDHSVQIIVYLAIIHAAIFFRLWWSQRIQRRRLMRYLEDLLGKFRRTDNDPSRTPDETIDSFLHDITDILKSPRGDEDVRKLCDRLVTKDEAKRYLARRSFETTYNAARTFIEAYPLMGILGTVLAIGVGLNAPDARDALPAPGAGTEIVQLQSAEPEAPAGEMIVKNFKNAIWSTVYGLLFGLGFMVVNSIYEPHFERIIEHRAGVRDAVRNAKEALFRMETHPDDEASA